MQPRALSDFAGQLSVHKTRLAHEQNPLDYGRCEQSTDFPVKRADSRKLRINLLACRNELAALDKFSMTECGVQEARKVKSWINLFFMPYSSEAKSVGALPHAETDVTPAERPISRSESGLEK